MLLRILNPSVTEQGNFCTHNASVLFLGAFTKLQNATISFITSVCPQGTTQLPLDVFSLNLIFQYFSKIC